jgi:acetolactate synthase-1/2/3 large subunit
MIDIDEKELERESVPIAYKYQMELKSFLQSFYHCLEESGITSTREREEWVRWCQERKAEYPVVLPEYEKQHPLNSYYVTSVLSTLAPENTNIMVDTGSVYCMASQSWKIKQGQRYLASGGFSSMGSWATALGMAEQGRLVLALAGDGSTQMNIQELATLQYNRIPVKLFIYNNQGYMLIRHNQHNYMQDRFLGVGPDSGVQTPDFCAVAKAYGIHAVRITEKQELERKLREVLAYEGPVVCEIMVQEFAEIIPKIASKVMPDGSLKACDFADLYPFLEDTL